MKLLLLTFLTIATVTSVAEKSLAAPKPPAGSTSQLPQKLPAKKKATKRTYIDLSTNAGVVIAPPNQSLNKALQKSEVQKADAEVRVQSRIFIPAPPGDLSEIPSISVKPKPTVAPTAAPATAIAITPKPSPTIAPITVQKTVLKPNVNSPIETKSAPSFIAETPVAPVISPPVPLEPLKPSHEFHQPKVAAKDAAPVSLEASSSNLAMSTKAPAPQTLAFVRTGYLQAKYGKLDSRIKDGATYVGLGVAREFETSWGSFEARASVDAFHAMDQSVTVDNIRMLATRTEAAYWLTRTRVRPGISLGLGWTDYSVRSYRSVSPSTNPPIDSSNQTVVLRTHAKSQAFTVIPGTSLRIEVADGLVIDMQTEFLAILSGESADAVQGLSYGIGLGWIF